MFYDTDDDLIERNFNFFVLKIILLIILNLILCDELSILNNASEVLRFNAMVLIAWFLWWMNKTDKQYQKNLLKLPRTAKSAESPTSRERDKLYREMAKNDAVKGKETDMRELQW